VRIVATFKNHGGTPAELTIKFPDESGDIDNNIDSSARSQAKKMKINIHKQLFDVKPRKFKVDPGELVDIEIF